MREVRGLRPQADAIRPERQAALTADSIIREEATAALRGLVDKIVAYPAEKRGQFDLELHGHLAAALDMGKHGNGGGAGSL